MTWFGTILVAAAIGAAVPAHAAADARLARECRAMALKAHPATLPRIPAVANLRQGYYALCVARHGRMDPELAHAR